MRAVRRSENRRLVTLVAVSGMIVTAGVSLWLWGREVEMAGRTLETRGEVVANSAGEAISDVVGRLKAVGGLYESSEQVTQTEFARFVENLGLIDGLGGIGYMPLVDADDVGGFEAEMREMIPGYALFELDADGERIPVRRRAEYAPVQWFEPFDAFGRPHGFDSLSEPNRRAALETARITGELAATPFLRLVSEEEPDGFLLYWPVTEPDTGIISGFVVAPMDLSELLNGHLPEMLRETIDWSITDVTINSPNSETAEPSWVGNLAVGGRTWMLTVTPRAGSDATADSSTAWLMVIVGVAGSVIAGTGASLYRQRSKTKQELEQLQELTRAKDRFLASVSHELRTPLTGVLGFAELLRDDHEDLTDPERTLMISNIADEATDLAAIIDDLLVAARSELDLLTVTRVPVSLRAQLAQVLEATNDPDNRIQVNAEPGVAYRAAADPGRVRQILRNLITNALAYGGQLIEVRLPVAEENKVRIQIADNGEGLPPAEWDQIFEPYHRAHTAETKPASLGIGLTVARQLAQLMGGQLTYTHENQWSVFELVLPAAPRADDNTNADQQSQDTLAHVN